MNDHRMERMTTKCVLLTLILSSIIACNNDVCNNLSYNLQRLQNVNRLYAQVDWNLDTLQALGDKRFLYRLSSIKGDTLWYTEFICMEKEDTTYISHLNKQYFEDRYVHFIRFKEDTLFHYKQDTITYEKIFISGKYTYQYMTTELSPGQISYYRKHKDSLDQVKGNSLSPIPELLQNNGYLDTIPPIPENQ